MRIAVAIATLLTLPLVTRTPSLTTAITFLAVLTALAIDENNKLRPLLLGLLAAAVVIVNDDPLVYAAAIVVAARFRRPRDYAVFAAAAVVPPAAWYWHTRTLPSISHWIILGWSDINVLQPFVAAQVALHIETHYVIAEVYWPLLLTGLAALWVLRNDIPRGWRTAVLVTLVVAFALQQLIVAPFDTANDPRRAFPVVLAFSVAYCWAVIKLWPRRAWRIAFVAVLVICALVGFSRNPAIAWLTTSQAIEQNPKDAMSKR
ncbi:MAG TPA: hypothetical protein VG323_04825 [Thermoanaerobaculia bacterium]|nr:hypothetical protein [Thermoanaerobaculia bacterium]